MRLLARGAATAIATMVSVGANAADLDYPPPPVGQPQYGMTSPPPVQPPQVIIVPGPALPPQYPSAAVPPPPVPGPALPPQYPSAAVPPPPVGPYPYGTPQRIPPRAEVAPPANCPLTWRCGERGCGWQSGCTSPQERYSGQYESPHPRYLRPESPGPQVYSAPDALPPPEPYPGPYAPEVYPGPTGPYSR
jgi:hypothetical protein